MTREEAIKVIDNVKFQFQSSIDEVDIDEDCKEAYEDNKEVVEALDMAIKALEQELCNDTVSRGVFEQVMWERDTAIEQLRELGYELGQKIEKCGAEMR